MDEVQKEVFEQLATQFSLALEGTLGEPWTSSLHDIPKPGDVSQYLCWSQKLNLHPEPMIQAAVGNAVWLEIGARALAAAGVENPEESEIRAAYLELLAQALSGLARFLSDKTGTEITLETGAEEPFPASNGGAQIQCLRLTSPAGFAADLFIRVEALAMEAIRERRSESQRASGTGPGSGASGPPPPAMDLLLDVELPVSVSFGRTHLALKDVIKLSTGSIVELNRTISEPVEVIVNNCVIARGEVVVVEGNYGVRIQQIVSRTERLRSFD